MTSADWIRLEDEYILQAFGKLPAPPTGDFAERLGRLDREESPDQAVGEDELRREVPFLRMAWLWLTAKGYPNLAATTTFLGLRRRYLLGLKPTASLRLSEGMSRSKVWQEIGPDLLRCSPHSLVEVIGQVKECCPQYPRYQDRFLEALLSADSLRGARADLEPLFDSSDKGAGLPGQEEEQRRQFGEFLAAWLPAIGLSKPADIFQKLRQEGPRAKKGKLVPGKPLPAEILAQLFHQQGRELLLRTAWESPDLLAITVRPGNQQQRLPKHLAWDELVGLLQGLQWEICHAEQARHLPEWDPAALVPALS